MFNRKFEIKRKLNELYDFIFKERIVNKLPPLYEDYEIIQEAEQLNQTKPHFG